MRGGLVELADRRVGHRHQRGAEQGDVLDAARIGADRVEPLGVGLHAGGGEVAVGRLVAHDAAEGGGPDHRTAGLRAGAQRRPGSRRRRRPSPTTSRPACARDCAGSWSDRESGWRIPSSPSCRAGSRPRRAPAPRSRHRPAAGGSCRSASRRSSAGLHESMMSFTPIGMPCSRPWRGPRSSTLARSSAASRARCDQAEHLGVALVDALEMGAHDRLRGHRPGIDLVREFGGGERVRCGHGRRGNSKKHAASTLARFLLRPSKPRRFPHAHASCRSPRQRRSSCLSRRSLRPMRSNLRPCASP